MSCVAEDEPFFADAAELSPSFAGSEGSGGSAEPTGVAGSGGTAAPPPIGSGGAAGASGSSSGSSGPANVPPAGEPPPASTLCSSGPFGQPEPITGLGLVTDVFGPRLSASGTELYFSSVDGDEDIWSAARVGRGSAFSPASPVPNLDAGDTEEGTPFLSADGLSLYFFSTRPGPGAQGDRDIWVASRPNELEPFGGASVVPAINGAEIEHLPWLSADQLTFMFVSSRAASNDATNIWMAERASPELAFGEPQELAEVNSDFRDEGFVMSSDGLTLYLASNRQSGADMDLWVSTRSDTGSPFGAPESLPVLNSPAEDLDVSLSSDGSELLFSSSRGGGFQIFRAIRECDG